jgi:hypothetical protein
MKATSSSSRSISTSTTMRIVRRVYDVVESILWAVGAACLLYFLIVLAPHLPEHWRQAESTRAAKVAAENKTLCEKWGMEQETNEHLRCIMDLQKLREEVRQEYIADQQF